MSARDRWIARHLRRLHFGQFLQRAAEWMAVYLFAFGSLVLIVKLLLPGLWPHVLWLGLGAVPVTIAAWMLARRGRFSRQESVAMLDRRLGTGGLLMTLCETPDAEWEARLPEVERAWKDGMPRIRPRRFASRLAVPLMFAVGVCFIPLRDISARPLTRTVGRQATAELEELLEVLDEAEVLEEQEEQQLREEIAKLAEETEEAPLTHESWETVDALEQRLRMQMAESVAMADQAAAAAELLAEAAAGNIPALSPERMAELESDALEMLERMQRNGTLPNTTSPEMQELLQRLMRNGQNGARFPQDGSQREQLLNELREMLQREQQRLAQARQQCQSGQCQGQGQCRQCGAHGQCNGQGLCSSCAGALGSSQRDGDGAPGRGGINRGRGDAEMSWGDESDEQGTKFKETVLPPGFSEEPKDDILGLSFAPPEEDVAASAPRARGRDDGPTGGQDTWDRQLRPRHREVVRRYFRSQDATDE
jgi:hypothetical protein